MKIIVALSLLAALCIVDAFADSSTDLEILRLRVRDMKWNVDTVTRQLQLLLAETEADILRQVSLKSNEEQDSYRKYKTLLISAIRNEIDAAKAAGKNVDSCYTDAINGIVKNEQVASNDTTKCEDVADNSIHSNLGFIDNLISTGEALSMDLDNIFLNCHDSDIIRMKSCIIGELATTESSLRTLENDSVTAEVTIAHVSKNVIMQAGNCVKQAYSNIHSAGEVIRMGVTICIEATATTESTAATEATTAATSS